MCYFGNEIQQDDYGSQTATLLEKLFRATRILDLERLPKHDPTRFILTGKDRAGNYRQSQIRYLATTLVPTYVRMRYFRGQIRGKKRESCPEKERRRLLLLSPPLISLFSQLRNRPRLSSSHWRAIRAEQVEGSWSSRKNNKFISPLHPLIPSLPDYL